MTMMMLSTDKGRVIRCHMKIRIAGRNTRSKNYKTFWRGESCVSNKDRG